MTAPQEFLTVTYRRENRAPGITQAVDNFTVLYVGDDAPPPDIEFKRFTRNYEYTADRKFVVTATRRRYKTLEAAARAVIKARCTAPPAN